MDIQGPRTDAVANVWLAAETIRRLSVSLVLAEQEDLVARGQMPRDAMAALQDPRLSAMQQDALLIDADGLGFDSLARLKLILRFNRFFNLSDTGIEDYLLLQRSLGDWCGLLDHHLRLVADRAQFTFATSGSAGPVKHISHSASDLLAEVQALRHGPLVHLAQGTRIVLLVPPHHIYGFLFGCLLPRVLGGPVLDLRLAGPTAVFHHAMPGDLIIGTTLNWQLVHDSGRVFPPSVSGITSAGASSDKTWATRHVNDLDHLTEVYGATETGGIGTRSDPDAPFRLLPHLTHTKAGAVQRARDQYRLAVQDRLVWEGDGYFRVLGRLDDVVKVGGVNVSPAHVVGVLCACDGVAFASVRLGNDRMKAFVVAKPGSDPPELEARLRAHILRNLSAPARPASLTFGATLPVNAMGKSCDWATTPHG